MQTYRSLAALKYVPVTESDAQKVRQPKKDGKISEKERPEVQYIARTVSREAALEEFAALLDGGLQNANPDSVRLRGVPPPVSDASRFGSGKKRQSKPKIVQNRSIAQDEPPLRDAVLRHEWPEQKQLAPSLLPSERTRAPDASLRDAPDSGKTEFSDDLANAERRISSLEKELAEVRAELEAEREKRIRFIAIATDDLFPGEGYDHAVEAIRSAADAAAAANGRKAEVLSRIANDNPPTGELARRRSIVDATIVPARRLGPCEMARLAEIGIREVSKNKHRKLGFGKHSYTVALTPSDRRSGQNASAEIKSKFF